MSHPSFHNLHPPEKKKKKVDHREAKELHTPENCI